MEETPLVTVKKHHPIAFITMNRPEKRNALSPALIRELSAAFDSLVDDIDVRVVVLKAEGNVFSAGADLEYIQQITEFGPEENLADSRTLRDLLWKIYTYPRFVIAQV